MEPPLNKTYLCTTDNEYSNDIPDVDDGSHINERLLTRCMTLYRMAIYYTHSTCGHCEIWSNAYELATGKSKIEN